jgi:hypothetical protein
MNDRESLHVQIEKAKAVLAESRENYGNNPDDYSAQLLLMSVENHLSDLLKQLDEENVLK